tara:strand:- start:600 stop:818 length:219 start_codon:yes stop_codon:yes gene_type:complete
MTDPLVPIESVAQHLKVSISTIRMWVRRDIIPANSYVKIGKTYRFSLPDVTFALLRYDGGIDEADEDLDDDL